MHVSRNIIKFVIPLLICSAAVMTAALPNRAQNQIPESTADSAFAEAERVAENAGWGDNVSLEFDGDTMIIKSDGIPNHEILPVYQALSVVDANNIYLISAHPEHMKLEVPLVPQLADTKTSTRIGLIGIAISGGLIYGPYEADGKTISLDNNFVIDGIPFIDSCNGHPNPFAVQYHYHGIPYCITDTLDHPGEHSHLLGYLLDGFPIYGNQGEDGEIMTRANLDECDGHFGATLEFPEGIYHYHFIEEAPYSVPCYSGVIHLSDSPTELFTRGTDTDYPLPTITINALMTQFGIPNTPLTGN